MATTPPRAQAERRGRPVATSHASIERAAFRLFAERGFEQVTMDDIAKAVGVSRRTLFRYFPSKNDIPWGQFDHTLDEFREIFENTPLDTPLAQAIAEATAWFNDYPQDADPPHVDRMRLILTTPALLAHSMLRYAAWRQVIADFVAERTGASPNDPVPVLLGQVSLAVALSVYGSWIDDPTQSVPTLIRSRFADLRHVLGESAWADR